jgi:hypothetical protein
MRKTVVSVVVLCGLLAALGCGGRRLEPPVEPGEAGDVLRTALDAWKGGAAFGELDRRDPPIYFNEREWEAGKKLVSYEAGPVTLMGRQGRCMVKLTLQDKQGSPTTRNIGYLIDTTPRLVITREALGP